MNHFADFSRTVDTKSPFIFFFHSFEILFPSRFQTLLVKFIFWHLRFRWRHNIRGSLGFVDSSRETKALQRFDWWKRTNQQRVHATSVSSQRITDQFALCLTRK